AATPSPLHRWKFARSRAPRERRERRHASRARSSSRSPGGRSGGAGSSLFLRLLVQGAPIAGPSIAGTLAVAAPDDGDFDGSSQLRLEMLDKVGPVRRETIEARLRRRDQLDLQRSGRFGDANLRPRQDALAERDAYLGAAVGGLSHEQPVGDR